MHVQVEELMSRARASRHSDDVRALAKRVDKLSRSEMQHMAAQAYHDILADDDRTQIEPSWRSPLAQVIEKIRAAQDVGANDPNHAARIVTARKAESDMRDRNTARLTQTILEGERAVSPEMAERLEACGAMRDPRGYSFTKEEMVALFGDERLNHEMAIESPVAAALAENGFDLSSDHPDRRALALEVVRAQVKAHRVVEARRSGDATPTPDRPEPLVPAPADTPAFKGSTLSEMRARWIALRRPGQKAQDANSIYVQAFVELYGDLPIAHVTRQHIRDFRDLLTKRPRNMPKAVQALPLREQIDGRIVRRIASV